MSNNNSFAISEDKTSNKKFYGWFNVVLSALVIFVLLGFNATIPIYIKPMAESLGVERSVISMIPSLIALLGLVASLIYGGISRIFGVKKPLLAGVLMVTAAITIMALNEALLAIYICAAVVGASFTLTTTIPLSTILSNWFVEKRGLVLGLVFAASGIGGMVFNPIVGRMIANYGWSTSMLMQAGIVALVGIPAAILISEHPEKKNQVALGTMEIANGNDTSHHDYSHGPDGVTLSQAVKSPSFYFAISGIFLISTCVMLMLYSVPSFLSDTNFDAVTVSKVMAGTFAVNAVAKIALGSLNDKKGIWAVLGTIVVSFILVVLSVIYIESRIILFIYPILFGISFTVLTVPLPLFTQYLFGRKAYAAIMGLIIAAMTFGVAVGPLVGSLFYDNMGSYLPAFYLALALSVASVIFMAIASRFRPFKSA